MSKIRLYCITCKRTDLGYEEQAEQACAGGADVIQLRDKDLSAREILALGQRLIEICRRHKALFILNDRPDLALALDADGVHLGQDDIPVSWARQILGGRKLIGCSITSLGQALAAVKDGASYVAVGPIFATPVKPEKEARGVDIIRMVKERVKVPVIAIGGISLDNVEETVKAGADGVAAIRSVCGARLIAQSARELKQKVIQSFESVQRDREHGNQTSVQE